MTFFKHNEKGEFMLAYFYKSISIFMILAFLLSCATQRLTYSQFTQIKKGMTEEEVINILGEPTKVTSSSIETDIGAIFGIGSLSGTNMIWHTNDAKAIVIFLKGKVKSKNFTNQF
ncbi:MAG: hypothetical protein DRQ49_14365 [Gammaproteobacteria bacterium]|nr:MAG: hypothetical protein DRQ41_15565 [Gammaproteobacteria bacterium]RKZ38418.1 MAG: hypothetical protein DRQ49_14365 [Gammaproteobacteria bacterium]RKZ76364.1 MAG: hypothetical protein DRQ57_04065 [Gammaproteobacteria bacterium]